MSDTKISALTALTGANVDTAADVLAIVDTSVTTTKKILIDELGVALTATQAEQEAGTSTGALVSSSVQQLHPSAAKAWAIETQTGGNYANPAGYNITSISKTGTGALTVTLATDFSSANYAVVISSNEAGALVIANTLAAGSFNVVIRLADGSAVDAGFSFVCYGDQA